MTVAAGIEIMPGGGGPKGLFLTPSGTQTLAWGANSSAGMNAGKASASDASSAKAVWQSVLTSLGVGASEGDAQEPTIDASPDPVVGIPPRGAPGKDGAKHFTPGTVSLPGKVEIPPASGQLRLHQASAGQVAIQHGSGTAPKIPVGGTSVPKSALAEASAGIGSSKDTRVSNPESADSTRKTKSSQSGEEVAAFVPQMAPHQSVPIPSQPVKQFSSAAAPHVETMWLEESPHSTAQPEVDSDSKLTGVQQQTDPIAARAPSNQGAEKEEFKTREVSAGSEVSLAQGRNDNDGALPVVEEEVPAGRQASSPNVIAELHKHPASRQIGAVVETSSINSVSGTLAPESFTPLETPIEHSTLPADWPRPDRVPVAPGASSAMQIGKDNLESKSNTNAKSREANADPRIPVKETVIQSGVPASPPAVPADENRASAVVAVAPTTGHFHRTAEKTEVSNPMIPAHAGSASVWTNAVLPAEASRPAVVPVGVPSTGPSGSAAGHGGAGAGEAFSTLDTQGTNRVTWVHAGAQQAEAGFEDPRLGWVSVRADANGGSIHASLVPASAEAAQVMGGHLEGLNAYLSEHHSTVETITLSNPLSRGHEDLGSQGQGTQGRAGQESGQGSRQENGQDSGSGHAANQNPSADSGGRSVSAISSAAQSVQQDTPVLSSSSGSRISLMA